MKTVDLFSGCGGFSLGFQNAGFEIIGAFDNWKAAGETYKANFTHPFYLMDIAAPETTEIIHALKPDVIIGGPPCQDFSVCGKRNTDGARANLTLSFAEIITDVKPAYFIMENVPAARTTDIYKQACDMFTRAGYEYEIVVLDASRCGVPQIRKRAFMLGTIDKNGINFKLPQIIYSRLSNNPLTVKQYLGEKIDIFDYYYHPRTYDRKGIYSVFEPAPTMRGKNCAVGVNYRGHKNNSAPMSDAVRALTQMERQMIQTFPPDFIFNGNKGDIEKQIGNAVPVNLAKFVGDALMNYINNA